MNDRPVWLGAGDPPSDALVYRSPSGAWSLTALDACPADRAITHLWRQRSLAQLAGMLPGDEGWPSFEGE